MSASAVARRALAALALAAASTAVRAAPQESCGVCHGREAREFRASVHARGGVSCVQCHGGVADALDVATAHGPGLVSLRDARAAVESCGGCHSDVERMRAFGLRTDQLSLYWTSRHGEKLAQDGDPRVATCGSCHGVHGVLEADNPLSPVSRLKQVDTCAHCHADAGLMAGYGIAADVVAGFVGSVHGRALIEEGHSAAPTCADCHGSHGAAPPRFADVNQVCGNCHSTVQTFFAESPHARSAEATVQCTSCHSDHAVVRPTSELFLGDDPRHCGTCHAEAADPARTVGERLHQDVLALEKTIDEADAAVRAAGGRGLFLGAEKGYLDEARGLLVRSRVMTHALSPAALEDILNRGQGMVGQTLEGLATKNRIFRDRKIFTGIFLGISLSFALVLWMYARALRRRGRRVAGGLG
jgi:hypothetical protein